MIRLNKLDPPTILRNQGAKWKERYLTLLERGEEIPESLRSKYRHNDIKEQIKQETNGKCAYCETKVTPSSFGDVEHIISRQARPEWIFEWWNLTLACQICNNNKGTYHDPDCPLLNPYQDDPNEHLLAAGPMVFSYLSSKRGEVTVRKFALNRPQLVEKRQERLDQLHTLLKRYNTELESYLKRVLRDQIQKEISAENEYSFVAYAHVVSFLGSHVVAPVSEPTSTSD